MKTNRSTTKHIKIISFFSQHFGWNYPSTDPRWYLCGWDGTIFRYILKYSKDYLLECWRVEKEVREIIIKEFDGITTRIFPAHYYPGLGYFNFDIIHELKKQKEEHDIIIHFHSTYNLQIYLLTFIFQKCPIIISNLGTTPPIFLYKVNKQIKYLFFDLLFRITLKYIDYYYASSKDEREYLLKYLDADKLSYQISIGIDFSTFHKIDKKEAKRILELDVNKKYIMYVGRFYKQKGVDHILKIYEKLKSNNIGLILIGGHKEDPLYQAAIKSGAIIHLREEDMPLNLFYCASDVYLILVKESINFLKFGGIGMSSLESLACGTPVVSFSLRNFPSTDIDKVGIIPESIDAVLACVKQVLENPAMYYQCREIAMSHYDLEIISKDLLYQYKKLSIDKYGK
jgi:glycosyltransferase involved in cell wall biosynthesis